MMIKFILLAFILNVSDGSALVQQVGEYNSHAGCVKAQARFEMYIKRKDVIVSLLCVPNDIRRRR